MTSVCNELNPDQLRQVTELMAECAAHDRAPIPVQFEGLLHFHKELPLWYLLEENGQLAAFVSIFNPMADLAEISACVKPALRHLGRFGRLMDMVRAECRKFGMANLLLVVDDGSAAGKSLADHWRMPLHHSEYSMVHQGVPATPTRRLDIRDAQPGDVDAMAALSSRIFGDSLEEARGFIVSAMASPGRQQLVAFLQDEMVGFCALGHGEAAVSINGVGIAPSHQGQGLGRELMLRMLERLAGGDKPMELEVDSLNQKALGLYRSLGFEETKVLHYYLQGI